MSSTQKTPSEWKEELKPEVFHIAFEEGTEMAFSHPLYKNEKTGMYKCAVCGVDLFTSNEKYDSGSGWPSFFAPIKPDSVETKMDYKLGIPRTEVHCANCKAHLGHIFEDGPKPTGLRYCINGTVLKFETTSETNIPELG